MEPALAAAWPALAESAQDRSRVEAWALLALSVLLSLALSPALSVLLSAVLSPALSALLSALVPALSVLLSAALGSPARHRDLRPQHRPR